MLCTNGHNNPDFATFCTQCGVNTFVPGTAMASRTTNGFAVASMVLGILWLYWVGSVLALVFGYIARQQIRERNQAGDSMALAGITLGWIGVGIAVIIIAVVLSLVATSGR